MKLDFPKRIKRDRLVAVRLPSSTAEKLKAIAKKHEVSQSEVVERLIEMAYTEISRGSKKG